MMTSGRSNPRKLPVVLQIRQVAVKPTSTGLGKLSSFWNARTLTTVAALPMVTLAVFVGWQLAGQSSESQFVFPEDQIIAEHELPPTHAGDGFVSQASHMTSGNPKVTSANFETQSEPWTGPHLAGSTTTSADSTPDPSSSIDNIVPIPPEQVQQASGHRRIIR